MRERNPFLFNSQLALGKEEAGGALLFGGEVAKHGGAITRIGDREVAERGDGGGIHEERLRVGKMGAHAVEDAEAGGIKIAPVGDFGIVEPVEGVELTGGIAGAEDGDGGWGGIGKQGQG